MAAVMMLVMVVAMIVMKWGGWGWRRRALDLLLTPQLHGQLHGQQRYSASDANSAAAFFWYVCGPSVNVSVKLPRTGGVEKTGKVGLCVLKLFAWGPRRGGRHCVVRRQ